MAEFTFEPTPLAGVMVVKRQRRQDERGVFARLFCADELRGLGWTAGPVQVNHSQTSSRGCIRGLHYQHPPHAEAKLVSCIRGVIWDVAVDLRAGSPSFLHWFGVTLDANEGEALHIPPGCAHGFQTLSDAVQLIYAHSEPYTPASEAGWNIADPRLGIAWPLPVSQLSPRDAALPLVPNDYLGLAL